MKKIFIFCIAFALTLQYVNAQNRLEPAKNYFSLGAEFSKPIGLFGNVYSWGIGASGQENFAISKRTTLTIYAGFINYFLKSTYGGGSEGYIPVLGGVRFKFSPLFFGALQSGFTFYAKGGGSAFTYSPGIGVIINKNFTALFKYVGQIKSAINSSAISVRTAYTFSN